MDDNLLKEQVRLISSEETSQAEGGVSQSPPNWDEKMLRCDDCGKGLPLVIGLLKCPYCGGMLHVERVYFY